MFYQEYRPKSYLSHHVESFWEMANNSKIKKNERIIFPPELNYDILIINEPISLKFSNDNVWTRIDTGIYFIGLITQGLVYHIPYAVSVFGIRLKPFSLSNIIKFSLDKLNNRIVRLQEVFDIKENELPISIVNNEINTQNKIEIANSIAMKLIEDNNVIDKTLREQLNYLMEYYGNVRIFEVQKAFGVSKVTLRNQFLKNVGLTPKVVSRIWRFNNFLNLIYNNPSCSLTSLSIDAGYYDQSHFIKEFYSFIGCSPNAFFRNDYHINISQVRIGKRFNSLYAPY